MLGQQGKGAVDEHEGPLGVAFSDRDRQPCERIDLMPDCRVSLHSLDELKGLVRVLSPTTKGDLCSKQVLLTRSVGWRAVDRERTSRVARGNAHGEQRCKAIAVVRLADRFGQGLGSPGIIGKKRRRSCDQRTGLRSCWEGSCGPDD